MVEQVVSRQRVLVDEPVRGRERGRWREFWRRYRRNRLAVVGLIIAFTWIFVGIFAPVLAPYSYREANFDAVEQMPSLAHPLGTDRLGRDQLSRIIWGARTALIVAPLATVVGLTIGLLLGALAGYFGRWVDALVMRAADVLFAFPSLLFALLIAATIQPGLKVWMNNIPALKPLVRSGYLEFAAVITALSVVGWPGLARLVRGQVLSLKQEPFVLAARAIGAPPWRIVRRHLLPNALPPVIVSVSMALGGAILAEATLSFFGIGIQPPTASWGAMIIDNYEYWRSPSAPFLVWAPGLVVAVMVLAFNFIGDGLNEALNPHLE